ncbi:MAG: T9SS type A sorting domain-containing protein [Bacteroidales bacterium]|jgi:hypothetical protein
MKKILLLALVMFFITLFGSSAYSQDSVITIDSIIVKYLDEFPNHYALNVCSSLDMTNLIEEKGVLIKREGGSDQIGLYPDYFFQDSIMIPIYNNDFDSLFCFAETGVYLSFWSYFKINGEIFFSNDSINQVIPLYGNIKDIAYKGINITVYPTIVRDFLNINAQEFPLQISIINLFGEEIYNKKIYSSTQINLLNIKSGIYCAMITAKDNRFMKVKIIKL